MDSWRWIAEAAQEIVKAPTASDMQLMVLKLVRQAVGSGRDVRQTLEELLKNLKITESSCGNYATAVNALDAIAIVNELLEPLATSRARAAGGDAGGTCES